MPFELVHLALDCALLFLFFVAHTRVQCRFLHMHRFRRNGAKESSRDGGTRRIHGEVKFAAGHKGGVVRLEKVELLYADYDA
jgi:hypothetical protein